MADSPRIGMNLALASAQDLTWHREGRFVSRALEALDAARAWFDFASMNLGGGDEPLDRGRLLSAAAAGAPDGIELRAASKDAHVRIEAAGVLAELRMTTPPLAGRGKQIVDDIVHWARAAAGMVGTRARVRSGAVYPLDVSYPPRRPPVSHDFVRFGTLVDFIGLGWFGEVAPDAVQAVVDGALPAGASRTRDGDLVVLRWVDDPSDAAEQARGCIRQEEWWASHIDARPERGWSALGDQWILPTALERRPPFTLFDAAEATGYRAVVVMPDGELDGASWSDIAHLTALRELDDGTPVRHVRLIVPIRESAIAIAEDARALGVDAVVYKDEDDTLWNVLPPGSWRAPGETGAEPTDDDGGERGRAGEGKRSGRRRTK